MSEFRWLDATAQAELVRRNDVHPRELVEAAITRIEAVDPAINAVVIRRFESAMDEARGPLPDGPFRGVPLLLKDGSQPSANDPWHCGSRAAKAAGHLGATDGFSVAALRRAGFVFLGRTNVPEFCSWPSTEPAAYGPTRNPWDLERTAGGSSGGSAAAVAAGMTACATGSDGGGSIRWPAGACGVIGLKPSRGRVSEGPGMGHHWAGLSVDGPITRSVRDAAALLDVMSARDVTAPYAPFRPDVDFSAALGEPPAPLRIGLCPEPPTGQPGDRERANAVSVVGTALAALGHEVELAWPDALADLSFGPASRVVLAAQVSAEIVTWERRIGRTIADEELETINRLYREWSRTLSAADYVAAEDALHSHGRRLVRWWSDDGHDLLIAPIMSIPTPPLGWFDAPSADGNWSDMFNYLGPFNISGQPGVSFPGGTDSNGMPIGVELVAGPGRDDIALQVALQLEHVLPGVLRPTAVES